MRSLTHPVQAGATIPRVRHLRLSWRSFLVWFVGIVTLGAALYSLLVWPWMSRWGATQDEIKETLPGDSLISDPALVTTKAVTIHARPEVVWPWLMQLGVDRGGMYSYLWVENWLLRLNVENSDVIRPEWQNLQVGDFIRFTPKDYALNPGPGLYVRELQPTYALTGCFGMEDRAVECNESATWQFVLEPQADGSTRLLLRSRTAGPPSAAATIGGKIGGAFQFYMERKMLLGIKERAEASLVFRELPVNEPAGR